MASAQSQNTIVVLGATGIQGSGVVRALLSHDYGGPWTVRALTQDASSDKAQKLLSEHRSLGNRLTLVNGNVYDEGSLRCAFKGAYGVFAMTSERHPTKRITKEDEMGHEIDAGRNIIVAARECGVKHLVLSSLPNVIAASGGKFTRIHHMNNKHAIEKLAREELDGVTALMPGFFYSNLVWPQYCRLREDGVVQFCMPIPGDQPLQWTDATYDMGVFASTIFSLGVEKTKGKAYLALGPRITPTRMAEIFTHVTGKPAVHSPISLDEFGSLSCSLVGPGFKEDAIEMMQWAAMTPSDKTCYGAFDSGADRSSEELGLTASSFENWLKRSRWEGPDTSSF